MNIEPDFLDHWKTRMLVAALKDDEIAPLYVLRIWAHCQNQRSIRFEMPSIGLKALCRFAGDASELEKALIESGFIEREGLFIEVSSWADHNAKLLANWGNGARGGRPGLGIGRQLDVSPSEWEKLRAEVFERDKYTCAYCGCTDKGLDCDHVLPLSRGGKSVKENLVAARYSCNRSKGPKTVEEWRAH